MLEHEIQNLARGMRALREFIELVEPVLRERASSVKMANANAAAASIFLIAKTNPALLEDAEVSLPDAVTELFEKDIDVTPFEELSEEGQKVTKYRVSGADAELLQGALELASTLQRPRDFRALVAEEAVQEQQLTILYESALLALASAVEAFLSQVLLTYFRSFPDRVDEKETVTLKELAECEDFDEARELVISRRVDRHMGGGLLDWAAEIESNLGVRPQDYFDRFWDDMVEVFLRRNLFAHNGGIVNVTYLSKVASEFREGLKKGDQLQLSREYLYRAVDVAELGFAGLAFGIWKKMQRDDKRRAEYLLDLLYEEYVVHGRWLVVEAVADFALHDPVFSENRRMVAKINHWQAIKWQGRFDDIRARVEKEDLSAHKEIFHLGQVALLDDVDGFFAMLPELLDNGSLSFRDLAEWPLFRGIRRTDEFQDFVRERLEEFDAQLPASMFEALQEEARLGPPAVSPGQLTLETPPEQENESNPTFEDESEAGESTGTDHAW